MLRQKMVDILIVAMSIAIIIVVSLIVQPRESKSEDVTETQTEILDVTTTEEENLVVGDSTEDATEGDTEAIEPSESTEGTNPPEAEEEPAEEPTEEDTYYCEWMGIVFSREEYELLCRTTYCEAGGESLKTQVMVCLAILNRYDSDMFADTIHGVVYAKNAFSVTKWKDFEKRGWNEKTEEAVQMALAENNHPRDMFYFRTGHYHKWAKNYKKVGKVYFSTQK